MYGKGFFKSAKSGKGDTWQSCVAYLVSRAPEAWVKGSKFRPVQTDQFVIQLCGLFLRYTNLFWSSVTV